MPITIDGNGTISGISAGGLPDSSVTSADIADAAVTPTKLSQPLTLATALAYNWNGLTTNTSLDFTGIPSWVKRITVMFQGVSTSGTNNWLIQIGAGSVSTSGYLGASSIGAIASSPQVQNFTAGFGIPSATGANVIHGSVVITNITSTSWVANGTVGLSSTAVFGTVAGSLALGGTLDRVRITTVGSADYFDAGSINIMYE